MVVAEDRVRANLSLLLIRLKSLKVDVQKKLNAGLKVSL
jgi:hypothetical protein